MIIGKTPKESSGKWKSDEWIGIIWKDLWGEKPWAVNRWSGAKVPSERRKEWKPSCFPGWKWEGIPWTCTLCVQESWREKEMGRVLVPVIGLRKRSLPSPNRNLSGESLARAVPLTEAVFVTSFTYLLLFSVPLGTQTLLWVQEAIQCCSETSASQGQRRCIWGSAGLHTSNPAILEGPSAWPVSAALSSFKAEALIIWKPTKDIKTGEGLSEVVEKPREYYNPCWVRRRHGGRQEA